MESKAQASVEMMVVVTIITLLFSMVLLLKIEKDDDIAVWSELYKKNVVCHSVANGISQVHSAGPYSTVNLTLPYNHNVSIYGIDGLIIVGDEPDTVSCVMPAGLMNYSLNFTWNNIRLSNSDGMVVIESE